MRIVILGAVMLAVAAPLRAQGWIEPIPGRPAIGVLKVRTSVHVRVVDRIAHVQVEEWFRNPGGGLGEGDYLYPLPGEAVFGGFSLFQGDEELRGETMDAERARRIYEQIVRRRKDPALIELVGHGLIRSRVFPIGAGETRRITLRYTQVLDRAGDALQFRYAAGGRFAASGPVPLEVAQGSRPVPERAPLTFTLEAENGERFRDAFSPTHALRVTREDGRMVVRPSGELDGDFALFLPLADRAVGITVVTHRPSGEAGYFMLTLSPGDADAARVPRDVTAVVDVSGSMSGEKIEQARRALRQLLGTLGENDRFRLIRFSSGVETWRPDWTSATAQELRDARRWVDELRAEGGTNIAGALDEAFRTDSPDHRLPIVIFLTDGLPSVGETEPERIAQQAERARGQARIFAFGVGYDVNTYLLDRLGAAGRGGAQYIQPGEDVESAVSALAVKVQHPVLADLRVANSPVRLTEIQPVQLPDLFAGEELVIFGRYDGGETGTLRIEGQRGGRTESFETRAVFAAHSSDNDYVPRLWASRKLGELARQVRLNGADPELVEEIRRTALRYGLLSEYTSYLVLEPSVVADEWARLQPGAAVPVPGAVGARSSTGQSAVAAAERSRRERDVRTLGEMEANEMLKSQAGNAAGRVVGGRVFVQRSGRWEDAAHRPETRVVEIEAFSAAYFEVLKRLPELAPIWKEIPAVLVAGERVSVRVGENGAATLGTAELHRLVTEFRGR